MSNNEKHTPGPWHVGGWHSNGWRSVRSADHRTVAEVICQLPTETEANARLIAAAPELLAALETITKWAAAAGMGNSPRSKQWTMFDGARAAIAKATKGATDGR